MANWCQNKLELNYASTELLEYLSIEGFSFDKIVPVPDMQDKIGVDQCSAQTKAWGTKWDLTEAEQEGVADDLLQGLAYFATAWGPPISVLHALSQKFPETNMTLYYVELGCLFAGITTFFDGMYDGECTSEDSDVWAIATEHFGIEKEENED